MCILLDIFQQCKFYEILTIVFLRIFKKLVFGALSGVPTWAVTSLFVLKSNKTYKKVITRLVLILTFSEIYHSKSKSSSYNNYHGQTLYLLFKFLTFDLNTFSDNTL